MASAPVVRVLLRPRLGTPRVQHPSRTSRRQQTSPSSSPSYSSSPPATSTPKTTTTTSPNNNTTLSVAAEAQQPGARNGQLQAVATSGGGRGSRTPIPIWQRLGPLTRAGEAYARAQRARPWATQIATSLVIYLCADLSAQRMSASSSAAPATSSSAGKATYDPARTARSLVIGGAAAIPGYWWFSFLGRSFNYAGSRALSVAAKVAVNQAVYAPAFGAYFFGAQALLAGASARDAWDRVRRAVPVSLAAGCRVWPAVTAVTFACVAPEYRPAFAGLVAVAWQTYLSYLNRREEIAGEEEGRGLGLRERGGDGVSKGGAQAAGVLIREGAMGPSMVA
ncbi:hypothetical protein F4775DRAFT_492098 [Biscogniauxia sp. FL1348]|nr:hypothetical protein F4775DRAFT_492098 [Biscogniauxia sp. FL1348]